MGTYTAIRCAIAGIVTVLSCNVYGFDLSGTLFETHAKEFGLEPELLYAVALAESANHTQAGRIGPSCLAIRGGKPHYPETIEQARAILDQELSERSNVDIGCMQINWKWHGHRVNHAYDLLDTETNIGLAASILHESIHSTPGDQVLGIGRYHHWDTSSPDGYDRAYDYGSRVMEIWHNLLALLGQ